MEQETAWDRVMAGRSARKRLTGSALSETDVLMMFRALHRFRAGRTPICAPKGKPPRSECPFYSKCPRWQTEGGDWVSLDEDFDSAEKRRAAWPCSRVLSLLEPEVNWIGMRR